MTEQIESILVEETVTLTVRDGDEQILPPGSTIVSVDGLTAVVDVAYDYAPFIDPFGPDHVFETDILKAVDGALEVERGVMCISFQNPVESRTTTRM